MEYIGFFIINEKFIWAFLIDKIAVNDFVKPDRF